MVPVYCITLDLKGERAKRTEAEFLKYNMPVTFVRGFNAVKGGMRTSTKMKDHEGQPYYIGPASVGCCVAHWMLWSHLLSAGVQEALIVEDDVKLCDDFKNQFDLSYSQLPVDWQFAFVGYCCAYGRVQIPLFPRVWSIQWPLCTHCYLIMSSCLPVLLDAMEELRTPVDIQLHENVFSRNLVKVYTFVPNLALQHNTYLPP